MPSPEKIAAKVAFGYAKAGSKLGELHQLYRPSDRLIPALHPMNLLRSMPFVSTSTPDNSFRRPSKFSEDVRFGLFDTRGAPGVTPVLVGDYIAGPTGTFFVASVQPLEPIALVACNVLVQAASASEELDAGYNEPYGGRTDATDRVELVDWPASITRGGGSESGRSGVPGDPKRYTGAICKLPATVGYTFRASDRIAVDGGDTWLVTGAILRDQGWELSLSSIEP